MSRVLVYFLLCLALLAYAWLRGGGPEKAAAALWLIAFLATVFSYSAMSSRFYSLEIGPFIVDLLTLAALIILMLHADRYWPTALVGLHLVGTAGHFVKLMAPDTIRLAYAIMSAFLAYPILAVIAIGVHRHQLRLTRNGNDNAWLVSWRSPRRPVPPPVS